MIFPFLSLPLSFFSDCIIKKSLFSFYSLSSSLNNTFWVNSCCFLFCSIVLLKSEDNCYALYKVNLIIVLLKSGKEVLLVKNFTIVGQKSLLLVKTICQKPTSGAYQNPLLVLIKVIAACKNYLSKTRYYCYLSKIDFYGVKIYY